MKITSLLTQYLYEYHRLDLPGIGSFVLDPAPASPAGSKNQPTIPGHIQFEYSSNLPAPTDLIRYISEQTGKMKALASSDLDSFIELAQQFLNIGKPFTLDGIGTLVRLKPGEYEFTAAALPSTDRRKETTTKESGKTVVKEEANERYESFLSEPKRKEGLRKPVVAIAIIAGLSLAIWGGYRISKKSNDSASIESAASANPETENGNTTANRSDTSQTKEPATQTTIATPATYTYVLENAGRQRAIKRYNQLRTNLWDVKLSTSDSVNFKLYMNLPVDYGDTLRIKDSLRVMLGRPVYIEQLAR